MNDPAVPAILAIGSLVALVCAVDAIRRGWRILAAATGALAVAMGAVGAMLAGRLP